jgi:hypothetical protein
MLPFYMAKPCLNVVNTNDPKMSNGVEEVSITKVQSSV